MRVLPFLPLAFAATAAAQVAIRVEAATDLRVTCGSGAQSIARGTNVTAGASIFADPGPYCQGGAASSVSVTPGMGVDFSNRASSTILWTCAPAAEFGRHMIRVWLSAPQSTPGTVVVSISPATDFSSYLNRWHAEGFVDIGDDQSPDVYAGVNARAFEQTVTLGPTPLPVLISVQGSALGGWAEMNVGVRFVTTGSHLALSGSACGPTLIGSLLSDNLASLLALGVRNSPVSPDAFLVLGLQQVLVPIPPTGCTLRTDIVVPVWVPVSAGGSASLHWMVGPQFALNCYAQYVVATNVGGVNHWHTSELLAIRLP